MRFKRSARRKSRPVRARDASIELEALEPRILLNGAPGGAVPKVILDAHPLTPEELDYLKELVGVASEGVNYNVVVDGYGTGWRPPTEDEWESMIGSLRIVDSIGLGRPDLIPTRLPGDEVGSAGTGQGPAGGARQQAEWTFMVYMAADNNLEDAAIDDFLEMASVGSTSALNIVVQLDRIDWYDSTYGDWTGTRRFLITPGLTPADGNEVEDLGEVNMGLASSLSDFVNWSIADYPANNYAVVLWDHGGGWRATEAALRDSCWDDTDWDYLENREVRIALEAVPENIDLLGFDACLMGMIETAHEVKDEASVLVASEELEPWDGWPYDAVLGPLVANPTMTPSELAQLITSEYYASYGGGVTQSAVDLSVLGAASPDGLSATLSELAATIVSDATEDDLERLEDHRDDAPYYSLVDYRDLGTFLTAVAADTGMTASISTAASVALDAYSNAVIANDADLGGGTGLSVYLPGRSSVREPEYSATYIEFAADTQWDEFLDAWYAPLPSAVDWSTSMYFAPIGSQGAEGSCTAWAVGYYTKTFQEAREHGWDLSAVTWVGDAYVGEPSAQLDHIFSPDFLYHQINRGADGGSAFPDAVEIVSEIGAATWATMPYDPSDSTSWPDEPAWREAPIYRGDGSIYYMDVYLSVDALKALLAGGNLAQIAIDAGDMYEMATLDNFYNYSINHANTIVGYDDNWAYTELGQTRYGAFKVANSWGDTWAGEADNDGCWWISYAALSQRVGYVTFYEDRIDYNPELLGVFGINHADRGQTAVTLGVGAKETPLATKDFISPQMSSDGNDPFPYNLMVLDLTEFSDSYVVPANFFLRVIDGGTPATGMITDFSVEVYSDYFTGVPDQVGISLAPPLPTQQGAAVYAETLMGGVVGGVDLAPYGTTLGTDSLYGYTSGWLTFAVINAGDTVLTEDFEVEFYLSDDAVLGGGDDYLIASDTVVGGLGALSFYSSSIAVTDFPGADPFATDGDYYLLSVVDPDPPDAVSEVHEDNNVLVQSVRWDRGALFYDDFSTDKGWTGYQAGRWQRGTAQAGGGQYGNPDPGFDATPTGDEYLLGYRIGGDYENSIPTTRWVTSPLIDLSGVTDVTLEFQRWLNVEHPVFDSAYVEVYDGVTWQTVFGNTYEITDAIWTLQQYDVSGYGAGNSDFRIRFGIGPTDFSWRYSGWNIDDVGLITTIAPENVPPQVAGSNVRPVMSVPVSSIEVYFTEGMALFALADAANYSLIDDDTGLPVPVSLRPGPDYVALDIAGAALIDGDYTLTLAGDGLKDSSGNYLDGDANGIEGGDYSLSFTFKLPGLLGGAIPAYEAYGGQVTFYDTTGGAGVADVDVRPLATIQGNSTVGITRVVLKAQYSEFGVVIQQKPGSSQAIAIHDQTFAAIPITYIIVDCDVSTLSLRSNLAGMDINGATLGDELVLPLDIDGDGQGDDPVGFFAFGDVGTVRSNARIEGDIVAAGDLDRLSLTGTYVSLSADVGVGGDLGRLQVATSIDGKVMVGGHVGRVVANGMAVGSSITAGDGLDQFSSRGNVLGDINVTGDVGSIKVRGGLMGSQLSVTGSLSRVSVSSGLTDSVLDVGGAFGRISVRGDLLRTDIDVGGALDTVSVGGDYTDGNIRANTLRKVTIKGQVSSVAVPNDEIRATTGSFALYVSGIRYDVDDAAGAWFDDDEVHAYVATP